MRRIEITDGGAGVGQGGALWSFGQDESDYWELSPKSNPSGTTAPRLRGRTRHAPAQFGGLGV
jgi:hypothetical protein